MQLNYGSTGSGSALYGIMYIVYCTADPKTGNLKWGSNKKCCGSASLLRRSRPTFHPESYPDSNSAASLLMLENQKLWFDFYSQQCQCKWALHLAEMDTDPAQDRQNDSDSTGSGFTTLQIRRYGEFWDSWKTIYLGLVVQPEDIF